MPSQPPRARMSAPRWSRALLRWLAPDGREGEILGDLEEVHRAHVGRRGRLVGGLLSNLETLDMAFALLRRRNLGPGLSWLDFKLGLRMLVRYPGLTTLGGLAIAFAIFAGAGTFEFLGQVVHPKLPFEDGDRMVRIQLWNAQAGDDHDQVLFDYGVWQEELTTIEELGAFDSVVRNLVAGGGAHLVTGAVMDAAGFRITGVEPLFGRTLLEEDEQPGSPLVVVLGYELWRTVFGSDPGVLGRVVDVGTETATVVGVMPEGFAFPLSHELWLPMRLDPGAAEPGEGPAIAVFGRLAPGSSLDDAQAELTRIEGRLGSAFPATHEHVRPFVKPYARAMLGLPASFSRRALYTLLLTLLAALVAGVIPGLKATRALGTQLRDASAGGGGFRFGGLWTGVIVSQIALTVVFPVVAFAVALEGREIETFDLGIPAHEYLSAGIAVQAPELDDADPEEARSAFRTRSRSKFLELEEKLLSDSRVAGVTFAEVAPRMYNGWNQIEVDGPTAPPQDERGHRLGAVRVAADFFETLGVQPRAGRDFHPADAEPGSGVVIVNEAFIDYVLGGRDAVGVQFRYVASERNRSPDQEPGPWLRIVGVVQDLGSMSGYSGAVVYHAVPAGSMNPAYAIVHVRGGDAEGFGSQLRRIAFDVDPTLRIGTMLPLDRIIDSTVEFYRFWIYSLAMVSFVGVVLSLGGIYSVMAFTVARRTREIGVRVALGAPKPRIVLSVFRRPLFQVGLGLLIGSLVAGFLMGLAQLQEPPFKDVAGFFAYIAFMAGVCLLACVSPTRRALAIEPSEAVRSEWAGRAGQGPSPV